MALQGVHEKEEAAGKLGAVSVPARVERKERQEHMWRANEFNAFSSSSSSSRGPRLTVRAAAKRPTPFHHVFPLLISHLDVTSPSPFLCCYGTRAALELGGQQAGRTRGRQRRPRAGRATAAATTAATAQLTDD